MTGQPDNLMPVYLRRTDEKVDRLSDDVRELKGCMVAVEENLAGVHRQIDRVELRIERIERRLDLADAPH
jgi:phage shock protein A